MLTVAVLFGVILIAGLNVPPNNAALSAKQQQQYTDQLAAYTSSITTTPTARQNFQQSFDSLIDQAIKDYGFDKIAVLSPIDQIRTQLMAETTELNAILQSFNLQSVQTFNPTLTAAPIAANPTVDALPASAVNATAVGAQLIQNAQQMWQNQSSADATLLAAETQQFNAIVNAMAAQIPPETRNDSYSYYCISDLQYTLTLLYQGRSVLLSIKKALIMNDLQSMVQAINNLQNATLTTGTVVAPSFNKKAASAIFYGGVAVANQTIATYLDDVYQIEESVGYRIQAIFSAYLSVMNAS